MKESGGSQIKKGVIVLVGSPWVFLLIQFLLMAAAYLVWTYSPSRLVAILIILYTTPLPLTIFISTFNHLCLVAIHLRKIYPSRVSDAFYSVVKFLAACVGVLYGKIMNGYEVHGKENLPRTTGGLLVYHHALLPVDALYLLSEQYLFDRTPFGGIISRHTITFVKPLCECFDFFSERGDLVSYLKKGYHCAVAPGGGIEGAFSKDYELIWNGRVGFAEVAKECGVPVIPMYTVNSQQAMPITTFGFYDFFLDLYKRTKKYPYFPVFYFPVKLRTYLGKPLFCGADESPAEFAERVKAAIYELRDKHQRRPGNFILAVLERFGYRA